VFNGSPAATNTVNVKAKVPDLTIEKKVSQYENYVGESFHYTVTVKHTAQSEGDAANVKIWDGNVPNGFTLSNFVVSGVSDPNAKLTPLNGTNNTFVHTPRRWSF
jgi:hypothetical protein